MYSVSRVGEKWRREWYRGVRGHREDKKSVVIWSSGDVNDKEDRPHKKVEKVSEPRKSRQSRDKFTVDETLPKSLEGTTSFVVGVGR